MSSKETGGDDGFAKSRLFASTSIWNTNIFSGISSRIEAAFNKNEAKEEANSEILAKCSKNKVLAKRQRSVFGQPEVNIPQFCLQRSKDKSVDSLDTLDSGHSIGGSTSSVNEIRFLETQDVLKSYRNAESSGVGSEQSTSLESSENDDSASDKGSVCSKRSESRESVRSLSSSSSDESQVDNESRVIKQFMNDFVQKIFAESSLITVEEKAKFGEYCRSDIGRLWFARFICKQRTYHKEVTETTFYSLVQFFAIVLFECSEADDFPPAKTIMNMCFTYYYKTSASSARKLYLYQYLTEQPIWRSLRFWRAAFFDAVQCERAKRPTLTRRQGDYLSEADVEEEARYQQNITFGQLGTFTHNMKEFGLSKQFCLEFLRKQCAIANLPSDQGTLLYQNIDNMFRSGSNQ